MKILVLTSKPRSPDNHLLWEGLQRYAEVDIHYVAREAQRDLFRLLGAFDLTAYDRVVLDLLFRYVSRRPVLLGSIGGLVLYEEDACQNFLESSSWHGKFEKFYRRLPNARIICTGHHVAEKLRAQGIDANFVPKGFDSSSLGNLNIPRDIEFGFIGRLGSNVYGERKSLLDRAAEDFGLQTIRTQAGLDYCRGLNRIRTFVSADIGFGEYMAKNFEAMACGCLLLACRQGNGEEDALGFRDGQNVLLYGSYPEFVEKAEWILRNKQSADDIAYRGMQHAAARFDYSALAEDINDCLSRDMPPVPPRKLLNKILGRWI